MTGNKPKSKATNELLRLGLAPRLLDLELAAAYVGLSAAAFLLGVEKGMYPKALKDGRRQHWDRKALDAAIDRRSGLAPSSEETPDDLMRAINAS